MEREIMKQEAIKRMKALRLHENAITEFDREDKLNYSEGNGILFWLSEEQKEIVREFEEKSGHLVYHAIYTNAEYGELFNLLFVGKSEEDWENDLILIYEGLAFSYVKNITDDWCSEYGTIAVKPMYGGVVRTA